MLNRALEKDPRAIMDLIEYRIPCEPVLAEDPTIQVTGEESSIGTEDGDVVYRNDYKIGLLGLLNGLFGVDEEGWGFIAAVFDWECPHGCPPPYGKWGNMNKRPVCNQCGRRLHYVLMAFKNRGN